MDDLSVTIEELRERSPSARADLQRAATKIQAAAVQSCGCCQRLRRRAGSSTSPCTGSSAELMYVRQFLHRHT